MDNSHFLAMIQAAQSHVSGRPRRSLELMGQSAGFLNSIHNYHEPALSACDAAQDYVDFEGLLTDLQPICNSAEAELVNLILNFFRSRKIYSAYMNAMQHGTATENPKTDTPAGMAAPSADTNQYPAQMQDNNMPNTEVQAAQMETYESNENEIFPKEPPPSPAEGFKNMIENPMFQSLLSPTQKENLNQIGALMEVTYGCN